MTQKREKISLNGWLNIDKPIGVSSTFITNKIKRTLNPKKIGHAGTLDPAASGVLPIALGEATKTIEYMQDASKTYIFTVEFGKTTDTLDKEGQITVTTDKLPTLEEIQKIIPQFTGKIKQVPPAYSALKINGKRAYELAREGIEFEIKEREVEIHQLVIIDNKTNNNQNVTEASFECSCSKGTYIRTLGADIALEVGSLGYITMLRRTRVGSFNVFEGFAIPPGVKNAEGQYEHLILDENEVKSHIKPIDTVLDDIPVLYLDSIACVKLAHGLRIPHDSDQNGIIRVYDNKKLIAICALEDGFIIPKKVFNL